MLLSLVLLPIIWNGLGFLHYVVEHTHIFCITDADHEHKSPHECSDIYHVNQSQDHDHLPTNIEFYELKQYITTLSSLNIQPFSAALTATNAGASLNHGRIFSDDIFHPPIC